MAQVLTSLENKFTSKSTIQVKFTDYLQYFLPENVLGVLEQPDHKKAWTQGKSELAGLAQAL